jgi:NitT/TauT family transport system substrate-binding protein
MRKIAQHERSTGGPVPAARREQPRSANKPQEVTVRYAKKRAFLLALLGLTAGQTAAEAQDQLRIAVGGRGIGETFVTEVGYKAGLFKKHNLVLDIFYTDGGGETQQAVISNSAQIGVASGFLGAIGVFAKGAPVRVIGASYTGGSQVFWYVPASSPIKSPENLDGKTVAYSTNGSSTHAGVLALKKHYNINFKPTQTGNAAATMTATMSGQVDVGWAGAPFGVEALETGKTRLIMKSSDAPDFDKQTSRVIIANSNELKARPDVFTRYMRGYRDSLAWIYSTPEGLKAYAEFAKLSEATARRALQEFLPPSAVNPDRVSGVDELMADAVTFKFITTPLTKAQLDELIRIPERRP